MNNPRLPDNFYVVIPAGGVGSRLWPLSRAARPKFLLDLAGQGESLLQATFARMSKLVDSSRILVVTGAQHSDAVRQQLPLLPAKNLVLEPSGKDSMAAIGLATLLVLERDPAAIIGSFAADHIINNVENFAAAVETAVELAETGRIVTVGIRPSEASTAFGYVEVGAELEVAGEQVTANRVQSFIEKPAAALAQGFFESGSYLWNAGMFVAQGHQLIEVLSEQRPVMLAQLREVSAEIYQSGAIDTTLATWQAIEPIAIDYAIAEPAAQAGLVAVVSSDFDWVDVGDFEALYELRRGESEVAALTQAQVITNDASGLVVSNQDRMIVVAGLENLVVIDTPDALLITTLDKAQAVKLLVADLKARGNDAVL
ncbi:MAG: mannose-1-phosphate guanylyltransferase [Microbacteriaceae bacterium]